MIGTKLNIVVLLLTSLTNPNTIIWKQLSQDAEGFATKWKLRQEAETLLSPAVMICKISFVYSLSFWGFPDLSSCFLLVYFCLCFGRLLLSTHVFNSIDCSTALLPQHTCSPLVIACLMQPDFWLNFYRLVYQMDFSVLLWATCSLTGLFVFACNFPMRLNLGHTQWHSSWLFSLSVNVFPLSFIQTLRQSTKCS